jgi:peptidoglycan/LPS O-acetylase OafA/YrhL
MSTSFGHDAVMVFFVLSGFLVSGSVIRDCRLQRFSWRAYAANRLTRLYVVLIPGLLLTIVWDRLGLCLFGTSPIYTGARTEWFQDYFSVSKRLQPEIAFGNLLFLQTIRVPPLGSNEPLWSLANEFWYYCLFPFIYAGILFGPTRWIRIVSVCAALAIAMFVGGRILMYFPIWLLGTTLCVAPQSRYLSRTVVFRMAVVASLILFAVATVAGHVDSVRTLLGHSVVAADYLTALGFSVLLYVLMHDRRQTAAGLYATVALRTAEFSYTLYVAHMPLLVFLRASFVSGWPWEPTSSRVAEAFLVASCCCAYAFAVAQFTEAKTDNVRAFVRGWKTNWRLA